MFDFVDEPSVFSLVWNDSPMWLPDGMVDVADSKSAAGNSVRVRVSGEPPLYLLKIFNINGTQDESAKTFIGRYLNIKNEGESGLGERVKTNTLNQSDLFFLKFS